jgi:hypothetical protein
LYSTGEEENNSNVFCGGWRRLALDSTAYPDSISGVELYCDSYVGPPADSSTDQECTNEEPPQKTEIDFYKLSEIESMACLHSVMGDDFHCGSYVEAPAHSANQGSKNDELLQVISSSSVEFSVNGQETRTSLHYDTASVMNKDGSAKITDPEQQETIPSSTTSLEYTISNNTDANTPESHDEIISMSDKNNSTNLQNNMKATDKKILVRQVWTMVAVQVICQCGS